MHVNLLPERLKERKAVRLWEQLKGILFGFLILWLTMGFLYIFLRIKIGDCKKKLSQIENDWRVTEPLMNERDALRQRKAELSGFLVFLNSNLQKGVSSYEKLTALSRLAPEEVWLREISFAQETKDKKSVVILTVHASVGYLKTDEELLSKINEFIERLKQDKSFFDDFENISLSEINKAPGSEKVMNFRFSLFLKDRQ